LFHPNLTTGRYVLRVESYINISLLIECYWGVAPMSTKENGVSRSIYFPQRLDETVEDARKKLGMNRSRFVIYAVTKLLQELSLLSQTVHNQAPATISEVKKDE